YTPMSISGAGDWTVYDGDGEKTYNIFRELYNPYQTSPIAFQLFDNIIADIPAQYAADAAAYSGQRYMLAPSAQSADNDNWLISPELSGNAQTVTFMAKSYTVAWPETLEIYYSTGDNAVASFTTQVTDITGLAADGTVPEEWTLITVNLPEGAKYFAIRHNTYDTLALFIDDVTYEAAPSQPEDLAIIGYHVFRDGEPLTAELHDGVLYTDEPLTAEHPDGQYEFNYTVVPVYNHGAVAESNVATVTLSHSGVEGVLIDNADAPAVWYNLQGLRVSESSLTTGVYIRVKGNQAEKIAVK
ncbi:MAG: choice-of-anchor J domain-containing protein, partial [Muribaculaceae bacterium]|nr:choice-of-anchor J domain-containing protein [Muribaculaceae bacterium]